MPQHLLGVRAGGGGPQSGGIGGTTGQVEALQRGVRGHPKIVQFQPLSASLRWWEGKGLEEEPPGLGCCVEQINTGGTWQPSDVRDKQARSLEVCLPLLGTSSAALYKSKPLALEL